MRISDGVKALSPSPPHDGHEVAESAIVVNTSKAFAQDLHE